MDLKRRPRIVLVGHKDEDKDRISPMIQDLAAGGIEARYAQAGDPLSLLAGTRAFEPDLALSAFFKFTKPDGTPVYVREVLMREGVAWIGSTSEVLELALSKKRMKEAWRARGIVTPDWLTVHKDKDGTIDGLERMEKAAAFPYIVKPANEGNSRGIDRESVVRSPLQLFTKACLVAEEYGEALVERYLGEGTESREFTAIIVGNGPNALVSAVEIIKSGPEPRIVTQEDKDRHRTEVAPIGDDLLRRKIERTARAAFAAAGVEDYARCDLILHGGQIHAIELNGQPMLPDIWFEACAAAAGLSARQYPLAIAVAGMARLAAGGQAFLRIPLESARLLPAAVFDRLVK